MNLRITPKNNFYYTIFIVFFICSIGFGQGVICDCKPVMKFLTEDCVRQTSETELGYYIYSKPIASGAGVKWVKVFEDGKLVVDKEVVFNAEGFFSDVISIVPVKDAIYQLEFHCDKGKCYSSVSQKLRTMPKYEILTKDISCHGKIDGETKLMPESLAGMDLVWESGEKKSFVSGMHFGDYHVTVENSNGCKEIKNFYIKEPKPLSIEPKFLSFVEDDKVFHCIKAEVKGGQASYLYDWDDNGLGLWEDKSHIICSVDAMHKLNVMDQNGCVITKEIKFEKTAPKNWKVNDVTIQAENEIEDGKYTYDLTKALDIAFGDMDGDGLDGSIFDVAFYVDANMSSKIQRIDEYISDKETKIFALVSSASGSARSSILLDPLAPEFCLRISEACDNSPPVELMPISCTSSLPFPTGGTYRAVNASVGPLNGRDESARIQGPDALGKFYFNPINGSGNYTIYYTVGSTEYEALFDVQAINPQFRPSTIPICGNFPTFELRANPIGGMLSGPGTQLGFRDVGTNRFFIIDSTGLDINVPYTYFYQYTQNNASGLTCTKVAQTTVTILDFPRVSINTFDQQVCEKESINLSSTSNSTDGSASLTYTWFFRPNGGVASIIGNTPNISIDEVNLSGRYIVEVRQNNLCSNRDSGLVQVFELPKVNSEVLSDVTCFGVSSARVNLSVENVTNYTGYTFTWRGKRTGQIFIGREQSNLPADSFLIAVTTPPLTVGGLQCTLNDTVVIRSFPSIGIVCSPRDVTVSCFGDMNISRNISVSPSATGPFRYSLSSKNGPWQTSSMFTGLGVGNDPLVLSRDYKVYVQDGNGCIDSCDFTIFQPQRLSCSLNKTDLTCFQNESGSVTATVSGGTAPFRYAWSNGTSEGPVSSTSSMINGLAAGTYGLTVTDANNCTTTCSITVNQPTSISPNASPVSVCLDHTTQVIANPTGGTGPYRYNWTLQNGGSTGALPAALTGTTDDNIQDFDAWCLTPGVATLRLLVTDNNNCTKSADVIVTLSPCFDLAIRKTLKNPNQLYYPGDLVAYNIEVFNQGEVDAIDVIIRDSLDQNLSYTLATNTISMTGNPTTWDSVNARVLTTRIPSLPSGQKDTLVVFLRIADNPSNPIMRNNAWISSAKSRVNGRTKEDPIDEDKLPPGIPPGFPPNDPPNERQHDICDESNPEYFPEEDGNPDLVPADPPCDKDNPDDEDTFDYEYVSICQLSGVNKIMTQCVSGAIAQNGLRVNTPAFMQNFVPDNPKVVALSVHSSREDARYGINPLDTVKVMPASSPVSTCRFKKIIVCTENNGLGNDKITCTEECPSSDTSVKSLEVNVGSNLALFARIMDDSTKCLGISTVYLDLTPQPQLSSVPSDVTVSAGADHICLDVQVNANLSTNPVIQWQKRNNNGTWEDIAGATTSSLCFDEVTNALHRTQYRANIKHGADVANACLQSSVAAAIILEGECEEVCNEKINVSLDSDCKVTLEPFMVLACEYDDPRYILKITDKDGKVIVNPIGSNYVGQELTVQAINTTNGNSCWGKAFIEDKLPPVITCPADYTVSCAYSGFNPPVPVFGDACDPDAKIEKVSDVFTELECGRNDGFIARRTLTYIAKDKYGNVSRPCTFNVWYQKRNIGAIVWPSNRSLTCRIAPSYPVWDTNNNNYPDVSETGVPTIDGHNIAIANNNNTVLSNSYCKINVTFSDTEIKLCGNSFKIIRTWTALDWCNRESMQHTQLIEVKDTEAPIVDCRSTHTYIIYTERSKCSADFYVPRPTSIMDCNSTTWTVAYLLADNNGLAPANGTYISDNVVANDSTFTIKDLPLGRTWLRYAVKDACDNVAYCFTEVEVKDNVVPTAVCDAYTVISLDRNGKARLFARTIDDGSHDNCSEVKFGIRRMNNSCGVPSDAVFVTNYEGNSYYTFVDFCCSDQINNQQMVELIVIDTSGNVNTCMTDVEIQQKILPVITCPGDVTVDCEAGTTPTALNSFATFVAGCPVYYLDHSDVTINGTCGERTITRTWTVKENGTHRVVSSCPQSIYVKNLTPFDLTTVIFPEDKLLINKCNSANDFKPENPVSGGYPTWVKIGCAQVAATYKDEVFENIEDACFKIVRTWTVIDWCTHNIAIPSTSRRHRQEIKVIDTQKPHAICRDTIVEVKTGCSAEVSIKGNGSDSCTAPDKLKYRYSINGSTFVESQNFSQNLSIGNHRLTWIVEDKCGNKDTCIQSITLVDVKKPTPYCLSAISTVLMPSNLRVSIWAKDYDHGATDNCSGPLRFTFSPTRPPSGFNIRHSYTNAYGNTETWDPAENSSSLEFTCDSLGLRRLSIYVWDQAGNSDYCNVGIRLQDNSGKCPNADAIVVEGNITSVSGKPMSGVVTKIIENLTNKDTTIVKSDVQGNYRYDVMVDNMPYMIYPEKYDDPLNGISTVDLVMIQRSILGLDDLNDRKMQMAADVNGDGKITASDLVELRKLILGVTSQLPNNRSWIFVNEKDNLMKEKVEFVAHLNAKYEYNFTGIKIGDMNMNAQVSLQDGSLQKRNQHLYMNVTNMNLLKDVENKVSFKAGEIKSLNGLQLSIELPGTSENIQLISDKLMLNTSNYHISKSKNKTILNICWSNHAEIQVSQDDVLFDLTLTVKEDVHSTKAVTLSPSHPNSEVVDGTMESKPIQLRYKNTLESVRSDDFVVYQNNPNPFAESTSVKYYISKDEMVQMAIHDVDGKLVYTARIDAKSGENEVILTRNQINNRTGVLLMTLSTSKDSKTIKLLNTQ
ncbi:MAG: DUF11 domain-containing protein [Saprospiraceae bacterium]|jgi:uncharacterized repeat protein (TIGR01451 family)|nr:DUF11 domain-containing protein [Saprospiraceae bacterium]